MTRIAKPSTPLWDSTPRDSPAKFKVVNTTGLVYGSGLSNCTNKTDPSTCVNMPLTLDLFEPINAPGMRPAIVMIHGGSYVILDSSEHWEHARWFAKRGFVTVSINYRLSGDNG